MKSFFSFACFIFFILFTNISFGKGNIHYDWRKCSLLGDISELKHSNVPFLSPTQPKLKNSLDKWAKGDETFKTIEECMPDTLFSWQGGGSLLKFIDLKKNHPNSILPFNKDEILGPRGLYFWRTPMGTFGYNDIPLRIKLKTGTKFIYINELKDMACTWAKKKFRKIPEKTVFVRYKSGLEIVDFILCDDSAIHSWSVWSPENLKEIILEKEYITKNSCHKLEKDLKIIEKHEIKTGEQLIHSNLGKMDKGKRFKRLKDKMKRSFYKMFKKRRLPKKVLTSLERVEGCLSWEAYSNGARSYLFTKKLKDLFYNMRFVKDWKKDKKNLNTLYGLYNRYPHFKDLMKDEESMGHHLIVQQVYSDFNKAKENYTSCGKLLVGSCMDRSKENWRAIQLTRKMQLFGKTYESLTGKRIISIERSTSDKRWWNKKDSKTKKLIQNLMGKEILHFSKDVRNNKREDHFSSRFKTIFTP